MQKPRVSCLCCRTKKIKCDKKDPCTQCIKSNNNNHCVYPIQGTLGRPPKNAVFYGKTKNNDARNIVIREFIFEYGGDRNSNNKQVAVMNNGFIVNKEWWILSKEATQEHGHLYTYFQAIYRCYLERGSAIRDRFRLASHCLPAKPRIKFNDLQHFFTWWTSIKVNMMIKRNSLLHLETNSVPYLTVYMFHTMDSHGKTVNNGNRKPNRQRRRYKKDETPVNSPLASPVLYSSTSTTTTHIHQNHDYQQTASDPLQSLPPEQAIHLIHDFFMVHPYSILINKTRLMKKYWSDAANPLLLAVIYGTTLCFSQLLHGRPVFLWESDEEGNRNPFLTHAHSLVKNLSTFPTISEYKATALLGLFEVCWGYSKLGMSLLSTSYLMGARLGLWDGTFKASDSIEVELVNMTFWAVYRATTLGCIELGVFVADSLVCRDHLFPPVNIYESQSYQSDLLHNNINNTSQHSYLIESFYSGAVVTHYSGFIHACLPKPYVNIYGHKTHVPTFDHLDAITQLRVIGDVETRVYKVLDDFNTFIQQQRHKWTPIQRYTIETTYRLYRIHFRFLQPSLTSGPQKYQEDLMPTAAGACLKLGIDPSNPEIVIRLQQVRGDILSLVDDLEEILTFGNDANGMKPLNRTSLLPHDIMVSAFETSARLLILSYQMDSSKQLHDAMNKLLVISHMQDAHQPPTAATKTVRHRLKVFLKRNPLVPTPAQQQYQYSDSIPINVNEHTQHLLSLHPPDLVQHQHQPIHLQPHDQPMLTTASQTFATLSIQPNINISNGNDIDYVHTPIVDIPVATSIMQGDLDTSWHDGNQYIPHQSLGSDDIGVLDRNAVLTQTLHPYGFATFLEQDQ